MEMGWMGWMGWNSLFIPEKFNLKISLPYNPSYKICPVSFNICSKRYGVEIVSLVLITKRAKKVQLMLCLPKMSLYRIIINEKCPNSALQEENVSTVPQQVQIMS